MLPIYEVLHQLKQTLSQHSNAVLIAPPGAGKTTAVPVELLNQPWLNNKKIIMLEPRRLAAKNAAVWISHQLSEEVGGTVGYRMRLDNRISKQTKIEIVTEAILTRIIQNDPELSEYGLIIFDEFHERHLQTDLGLALCLEIQENLRDDLKLLVMSATLEGEQVSTLLGNSPLIKSKGRSYPVEHFYLNTAPANEITQTVVNTIISALDQHAGSILVFLPGVKEIKKVERHLLNAELNKNISICPLYGNLSQHDQEKAISPNSPGKRKIVLATSIAESSLTIEGITIVIDAGLMRVPRFNPRSEMTQLETLNVSLASAEQRAGRAGRLSPGVCYRLWTKEKHAGLIKQTQPEILQTDLVPLILELAHWGTNDPEELMWLDSPPASSTQVAQSVLRKLGALDSNNRITAHGKQLLKAGIHPRLAHMVIKAKENNLEWMACDIAALLTEKDVIRYNGHTSVGADLRTRLAIIKKGEERNTNIDTRAVKQIRTTAKLLRKQLSCHDNTAYNSARCGVVLALAYPDRVAQLRTNQHGRYLMSNGKAASLFENDELTNAQYMVVANLDGNSQNARIYLAAEISKSQLVEHCSDLISSETTIRWNSREAIVKAVQQEKLGVLVLKERPLTSPPLEEVSQALISGIREKGFQQLPWSKQSITLRNRISFIGKIFPDEDWPDLSDKHLENTLESWLQPFLSGKTKVNQIRAEEISDALNSLLDWNKNQALNKLAPTHITVPSGSRIPVDYSMIESPILAVRLQELFGQRETPTIAGGKVPLLIHLLSPARRPMQVTKDLTSFWEKTYEQVKKDLKGKYPKHYWPDDPITAIATSRAKQRKKQTR